MARPKGSVKLGGRAKGTPNKDKARVEEICKAEGLNVIQFLARTALGHMSCGKCLGSKKGPKVGAKPAPVCAHCEGSGREHLKPQERVSADIALMDRIVARLKTVELGHTREGKGGHTLSELLAWLNDA